MAFFDITKQTVTRKVFELKKRKSLEAASARRALRLHHFRTTWSFVLTAAFLLVFTVSLSQANEQSLEWTAEQQAELQKIRAHTLSRYAQLPVTEQDPKTDVLRDYLIEKKSPLVDYVGYIARSPNYRLLLGIAQAESNLCKKTDKNNCWGIGPGKPFAYDDIAHSLYHADYLIDLYGQQGMTRPETMVNTYVGYHNPTWIAAINDVFYELEVRGL